MTKLVVSFVGRADLMGLEVVPRSVEWSDADQSPILRLLLKLANEGQLTEESRVLLFDDRPADGERRDFAARLRHVLAGYRISAKVDLQPFTQRKGPTDYEALFEHVWKYVPHGTDMRKAEVCFHLSSGTGAMQSTMMLAALCLPLDAVRLFETSRQNECLEVNLPYVIALRRRRERQGAPGPGTLDKEALRGLIPGTVLDDDEVLRQFVALHNAARNLKVTPVVIGGPTGSGKLWAAMQYAKWAGCTAIVCPLDDLAQEAPPVAARTAGNVIVLRHAEQATLAMLERWRRWVDAFPERRWVLTWRTDRGGNVGWQQLQSDGLPGAVHLLLPDISTRSDIVKLAESIARDLGLWDSKLKERLQHEVFSAAVPCGLHSLRSLLATAAAHARSSHLDAGAFETADRTRVALEAAALLQRMGVQLAALQRGRHVGIERLLDAAKVAAACVAMAGGRSQTQAAELLGCKQQAVSSWMRKVPDAMETLRRQLGADGDR